MRIVDRFLFKFQFQSGDRRDGLLLVGELEVRWLDILRRGVR
jgi:hypothetical protein